MSRPKVLLLGKEKASGLGAISENQRRRRGPEGGGLPVPKEAEGKEAVNDDDDPTGEGKRDHNDWGKTSSSVAPALGVDIDSTKRIACLQISGQKP